MRQTDRGDMMNNYSRNTGAQLEDQLVDALMDSIDTPSAEDDAKIAGLQREYGWRLGAIDYAKGTTADQTNWSAATLEGYEAGRVACAAAIKAAHAGRK